MSRRRYWVFGLLLALVLGVERPAQAQTSVHLALGMPKDAKADLDNPDPKNHLMVKPLFALSYNSTKGTPNWVSWRLVKEDTGSSERPDNAFHPDPDLPDSLFKVRPAHYDHTGFDQGHMCPNADRDKTEQDAIATFVMTNMVPQSPVLNRRSWARVTFDDRFTTARVFTLFLDSNCNP